MSKTMTVRLEDREAAALEMLARAEGQAMAETIRTALDRHIDARRNDPDFQDRLTRILEEDKEALERLGR